MRAVIVLLAAGFVMPGSSVLKRFAAARDALSVNSLKIDGLVTATPGLARELAPQLGSGWTSGDLTLTATLAIRFPSRCRLDVTAADSTKQLSFVWANGKKRSEGGESAALMTAVEHACALLTLRSGAEGETREHLSKYVKGLGIDTTQTSLARFSGGVALVLGQRTEGKPQLWVSRELFVPVRLKVGELDLRFIDYTSQSTGEWFPRVLEVHSGGQLVARLTALAGDGRAELTQVKF